MIVFTSIADGGNSEQHHSLFISFNNKPSVTIPFYDRTGEDMSHNKVDMWIFNTGKHNLPCFTKCDVDQVAIVQNGTDNWHIHSVFTLVTSNTQNGTKYSLLTADMEANRWIGTHNNTTYERFVLTLRKPPSHCHFTPEYPVCPASSQKQPPQQGNHRGGDSGVFQSAAD